MKTIQPKTINFQINFDFSRLLGAVVMIAVAEVLILTLAIFGGAR